MNLIKQGYISHTIGGFNFIKALELEPITDYNQPAIIFGLYNDMDWNVIAKLKSNVTILWGGGDVLKFQQHKQKLITGDRFRHITVPSKNAVNLKEKGIDCEIVPMISSAVDYLKPIEKKDKIYSYIPPSNPNYYNKPMVDQLNLGDKLLIGLGPKTGGPNQNQWSNGEALKYYSQCFLGLFLCEGAGGGLGIVEMGLCGIKVITNVLEAPHTIPWKTKEDILNIIKSEEKSIGTTNVELANQVREWMSNNEQWLKMP